MTDEDVKKAEILKAELQKVIDYFKECEEATEHKEQKIPLGVPCDGIFHLDSFGETEGDSCRIKALDYNAFNSFSTEESAEKHAKMLLAWREALVANAKGEPIDIQVLLPLLPKGWVTCDNSGDWFFYHHKPHIVENKGFWDSDGNEGYSYLPFNLRPADDWRNSLKECGL